MKQDGEEFGARKVEVLRGALRLVDERGFDEIHVGLHAVPWTSFLQWDLWTVDQVERDEALSVHERDVRGEARGAFVVPAGRTRRSRPVISTEYPRGGRGVAAIRQRHIYVAAAASPRFVSTDVSTDYPRRGRGVAATRLHGLSTSQPRRRSDSSEKHPTSEPRRRRDSSERHIRAANVHAEERHLQHDHRGRP